MHQLKKLDRGTVTRRNTKRNHRKTPKNYIKYNTETEKWECRQCPQQYEKQSMENAIQRACKHKQQNKEQNNTTWKDWAKEQKNIRDCRIRTLLKWKHPEMDTSNNTSPEKGKNQQTTHTPEKHNAQKETQKHDKNNAKSKL